MNDQEELSPKQSAGTDPKLKRNSGLFSFFRWFKSPSRESVHSAGNSTGSSDSLNSTGTAASFSFLPPTSYIKEKENVITPGPETDTYKARLKQRDKIREKDKNLTLRKKYNLFFQRECSFNYKVEDTSKSLPLMTKRMEEERGHRRTNSDSSKTKTAGAYLHVKGKRKAPQPPKNQDSLSLRRKKRLAPAPPTIKTETILATLNGELIYADAEAITENQVKTASARSSFFSEDSTKSTLGDSDVLFNDSLKLDHGILKSTKEVEAKTSSSRTSVVEAPVSPRPWYKRNTKKENKYEFVDTKASKKVETASKDKRKSNMLYLTNISELDREAGEIIKNKEGLGEMPEFMRPKVEEPNTDSLINPKRKSAKDLIAKFNAITNVTKVTVNSAFFSARDSAVFQKDNSKRDYFGRQISKEDKKKNNNFIPLAKCETSACILKPATPKLERKGWACPKCKTENDYWRIICHVCSNIKPYFDDLGVKPETKREVKPEENPLERSKTQIGFTLHNDDKKEEREKLKKMLIEMKNSLPKRKSNVVFGRKNSESKEIAVVDEKKTVDDNIDKKDVKLEEVERKLVKKDEELRLMRPIKVSSSVQTSSVVKKIGPEEVKVVSVDVKEGIREETSIKTVSETGKENGVIKKISVKEATSQFESGLKAPQTKNPNFQLMRPKDFEDIYSEKSGKAAANPSHLYANLAQNENLFLNMPKRFSEIKTLNLSGGNTDTLEINRLLRRLENAIAKGDLSDAAIYARELAQLKVNCSVVRQKSIEKNEEIEKNGYMIEMYVEDRLSHRGPFPIQVTELQTVAELKKQVEKEFEIPAGVQRWILGKELASSDAATLKDHNVTTNGCPVFLYLVAPTNNNNVKVENVEKKEENVVVKKGESVLENSGEKKQNNVEEKEVVKPVKKDIVAVKNKEDVRRVSKEFIVEIRRESVEENANEKKIGVVAARKVENVVEIKQEVASGSRVKVEIQEPSIPRIVDEKLKKTPNILPKITQNDKTNVLPSSSGLVKLVPPRAQEEDFTEYDKTLTPSRTWACSACTLINPQTAQSCLVCSTQRQTEQKRTKKKAPSTPQTKHYLELMNLDSTDLVTNIEPFECLVCLNEIEARQGVTLRECLHQFCKLCLANTVEFNEEAEVKCPYRDENYSCDIALQDREIKALVSAEVYDQFLAKSVAQAENRMDKSFHCKTPDCKGWCVFEDNVNEFKCPVCRKNNCLTCQAIHVGLNCKEYQERMNVQAETDEDAKRTREMLEEMVNKGEALTCPACQVVLMKKWGCDWVRCSMCKTEICWVTRGLRWGPGGKGDTSGGCKCGVNGIKCHAQCNYCH